ncbi:hypothetical protein GCM10010302_43250 [Streptomyces polychromogenes]|uniref:Uncharacterized protein n=1 Tax=Streptomyces polychromogenes TaxID=67342 RepID=A0ABN0VHF3_9ACTN
MDRTPGRPARGLVSTRSRPRRLLRAGPGPHSAHLGEQAKAGRYGGGDAQLGTRRTWPTIDWASSTVLREFQLGSLTPHAEFWVRTGDMRVDSDECRSSNADDVVITDRQLHYLGEQFEHVMRPREAEAFGVPKPRDDRVVVLVDNIPSGGSSLTGWQTTSSYQIKKIPRRLHQLLGTWASTVFAIVDRYEPTDDPAAGPVPAHRQQRAPAGRWLTAPSARRRGQAVVSAAAPKETSKRSHQMVTLR